MRCKYIKFQYEAIKVKFKNSITFAKKINDYARSDEQIHADGHRRG